MGWYGNTSWNVNDYPEPKYEEKVHRCPTCGDECEFYYMQDGEVIGCEHCITQEYADEVDASE